MDLTRSDVERLAAAYSAEEPLYAVERESIELLPEAFADGEFGWRDAEWVVRWYFRRYLGSFPHSARRDREARFGVNDFEDVRDAVVAAARDDPREALSDLTHLAGVDVPVASAFLQFARPGSFVVVDERTWSVLRDLGSLSAPYPDPPTVDDYERYLDVCRGLCDEFDCDGWTLYMALWRRWKETHEEQA